jgi:hypothetical protein
LLYYPDFIVSVPYYHLKGVHESSLDICPRKKACACTS